MFSLYTSARTLCWWLCHHTTTVWCAYAGVRLPEEIGIHRTQSAAVKVICMAKCVFIAFLVFLQLTLADDKQQATHSHSLFIPNASEHQHKVITAVSCFVN